MYNLKLYCNFILPPTRATVKEGGAILMIQEKSSE